MPAVTDFWWVSGCVGSRWLSAGSEVVGLGWVGGYVSCVCVCVEVGWGGGSGGKQTAAQQIMSSFSG